MGTHELLESSEHGEEVRGQMTLMPVSYRPYTPEQFLEIEEPQRFELIDGELVERNMGSLSSVVGLILGSVFVAYVRTAGGVASGSDGGIRIFGPEHPSWVRFPDVAYYKKGIFPQDYPPDGWSEEVPTLVVEVVSPNDTSGDIEEKVQLWLNAGVPTVWVIHPETRTAAIRKLGAPILFVQGDELLSDRDLPGFAVEVSALFPPSRPA